MSAPLEIRIDPGDFRRIMAAARQFDAAFARQLRKNLRDAGNDAVKDVRRRVMGRTFSTDAGLASSIASATKLSIRTGVRSAGISIRTAGSKGGMSLARAFNQPSFRHPVYGRDTWVSQRGRPYFGYVLDQKKAAMLAAMERTVREAAEAISR